MWTSQFLKKNGIRQKRKWGTTDLKAMYGKLTAKKATIFWLPFIRSPGRLKGM